MATLSLNMNGNLPISVALWKVSLVLCDNQREPGRIHPDRFVSLPACLPLTALALLNMLTHSQLLLTVQMVTVSLGYIPTCMSPGYLI